MAIAMFLYTLLGVSIILAVIGLLDRGGSKVAAVVIAVVVALIALPAIFAIPGPRIEGSTDLYLGIAAGIILPTCVFAWIFRRRPKQP